MALTHPGKAAARYAEPLGQLRHRLRVMALAASQAFATSRIGLMLRASRDDEVAAKAAGVNVVAVRLAAFAFSAALVGSGGDLYAHFLGILTIDVFYLNLSFITLAMLVVGGLGDLGGAVVGVLAVTVITQLLRLFERGVGLGSVTLHVPMGRRRLASVS